MSSGAEKYGKYYWCIKTKSKEAIMLNADTVEVSPSGVLVAYRVKDNGEKHINFAIPTREWTHFWAASMIDGSPVAVDSWTEDEIEEKTSTLKKKLTIREQVVAALKNGSLSSKDLNDKLVGNQTKISEELKKMETEGHLKKEQDGK